MNYWLKKLRGWITPSKEVRLFALAASATAFWMQKDNYYYMAAYVVLGVTFAIGFAYYLKKWYVSHDELEKLQLAKEVRYLHLQGLIEEALENELNVGTFSELQAASGAVIKIIKQEL